MNGIHCCCKSYFHSKHFYVNCKYPKIGHHWQWKVLNIFFLFLKKEQTRKPRSCTSPKLSRVQCRATNGAKINDSFWKLSLKSTLSNIWIIKSFLKLIIDIIKDFFLSHLMLEALDGFIIVLGTDGHILYTRYVLGLHTYMLGRFVMILKRFMIAMIMIFSLASQWLRYLVTCLPPFTIRRSMRLLPITIR